MPDSFKIDGRMGDEKQKITGYVRYAENCNSGAVGRNILIVMRWRDGGTGLKQWRDCGTGFKFWLDAELNNSSLDHHNSGSIKQEYSKIQGVGSGRSMLVTYIKSIQKTLTQIKKRCNKESGRSSVKLQDHFYSLCNFNGSLLTLTRNTVTAFSTCVCLEYSIARMCLSRHLHFVYKRWLLRLESYVSYHVANLEIPDGQNI